MSQATKTLRQPLEHRPGVYTWFTTTQRLFNQVAAFYWQVLDAHPAVLELPAKDALTRLEQLTHTTADNPHPDAARKGLHRRSAVRAVAADITGPRGRSL